MTSPSLCKQSVKRKRPNDSQQLLQYANEKRNQGMFNNSKILVNGECILVNDLVLACHSKYFEDRLQCSDGDDHTVEILGTDKDSVAALIEYMYTGEVVVDQENVINLFSAADLLKMEDVKEFCAEYLEKGLTSDICFHLLNKGTLIEPDLLKCKVYEHISQNFQEFSQLLNFTSLSKTNFISCISNLDRKTVEELLIYKAMLAWTMHDHDARKGDFPNLFEILKLDRLPSEYVVNVVAQERLVKENHLCSKLVMNSLLHLLKVKEMKRNGNQLLSLGGKECPSKVVVVHSLFDENPQQFPMLPGKLYAFCALKLQNSVYCIGGKTVGSKVAVTNQVWQMSLQEEKCEWKEVAVMNERRCLMGAAVYHDTLVVAGGGDGSTSSATVEVYIKPLSEWKMISPLKQSRHGNALVVCRDCLLVVGGKGGGNFLSSVERLSSLKGKWEEVEPMQTPRLHLAAVVCKDFVYAIGGRSSSDNTSRLKSVEKYDPIANTWTYVSDMNIERNSLSACVVLDKIYVVGGLNLEGKVVKEIECYDPDQDTWSIVGMADDPLYHHALAVL